MGKKIFGVDNEGLVPYYIDRWVYFWYIVGYTELLYYMKTLYHNESLYLKPKFKNERSYISIRKGHYSRVKGASLRFRQIDMNELWNIHQSGLKRANTNLFQAFSREKKRYYLKGPQDKVSSLQNYNAIMWKIWSITNTIDHPVTRPKPNGEYMVYYQDKLKYSKIFNSPIGRDV